MSEQMELPIRRARVALAEDTEALPKEAGGGKARRGRIRLVQREPLNYPDEAAVGYSDWFLNARSAASSNGAASALPIPRATPGWCLGPRHSSR
jgi:hypothetical protein